MRSSWSGSIEVLGIIALGPDRERQAGELAHGQKAVAGDRHAAHAQDPDVLLVDEPAAGMTDAETEQTADLLTPDNSAEPVGGGG